MPLESEKEINYTKLSDLLWEEKIWEAEQETTQILMVLTDSKDVWSFEHGGNSCSTIPCTDLKTIDRLWLKSTRNKSFSAQSKLFEYLGGIVTASNIDVSLSDRLFDSEGAKKSMKYYYSNSEVFENFLDVIGWKKGSDALLYTSIDGQYPRIGYSSTDKRIYFDIWSRLKACSISCKILTKKDFPQRFFEWR